MDVFKNSNTVISDDFKSFAASIDKITQNDTSNGWVAYAQSIGNTDKELLNFLSDVDNNKHKISDIDSYMQSASTSTAQFTATLKNIAVNALPIFAISAAIQLVQAGWDALNVTVEEQEAKVNSLQTAYQDLQSEYEQLSGKQDPTDAEKDRLSYLERRLELDERILKAEKSQLFDEKTGDKFTDLFDPENMETQY